MIEIVKQYGAAIVSGPAADGDSELVAWIFLFVNQAGVNNFDYYLIGIGIILKNDVIFSLVQRAVIAIGVSVNTTNLVIGFARFKSPIIILIEQIYRQRCIRAVLAFSRKVNNDVPPLLDGEIYCDMSIDLKLLSRIA